ncbi:MAG: phenylalanine--tRNA ligase subunit beta, partial [Verrucomicrobia bacterium]|nr:phenylalanine--tRNA ligase subunit beta [Verrucomicrobiota bacterium]
LRGVVSEGMICSERELGLGDDHDGILVLERRPPIGSPANEIFPAPDTVFDLEITPNRPDALSHMGIARELAAFLRKDLQYPELELNLSSAKPGKLVEELECTDTDACPHYRGYSVRGVSVEPSPEWLQRRLRAVGLRPINNVVDLTNYVLLETGQPLHAFDVRKIRGGRILVRPAREKEKITTLDDKERSLHPGNLVIADAERALVVAGVMGSVDAEVEEATTDLFLEAAYFDPVSVRRTSRHLGLSTDSSYRFERGVDPRGAEYAALRCLDLILQHCGGELLGPPLLVGEPLMVEQEVILTPGWVRSRLGYDISDEEMEEALQRLELGVGRDEDDEGEVLFRVGVPSHRQDLYRPIDLVEEIVRMHGSDKIPEAPVKATVTLAEDDPVVRYRRKATEQLVGKGFHEAIHYTLRSESELRLWYGHAQADSLAVANPLASDASHLRTSVIPGLLDCLQLNRARHNEARRLFEIGRVFREYCGAIYEMVSVGFVCSNEPRTTWREEAVPDYYMTARVVTDLLAAAGVNLEPNAFAPIEDENAWLAGQAAQTGSFERGYEAKFGMLHVGMTRRWDLEHPVLAGAVYFLPEFLKKLPPRRQFRPFSDYPPAIRDLAVVAPSTVSAGEVQRTLASLADAHLEDGMLLESLAIFDVYEGKGLAEGHRSLAFKLVFRHPERTLRDKEVNAAFQGILQDLDARENLEVRR